MRKSTIPEWAIARKRPSKVDPKDDLVQDMQFISYLVVFGTSAEYTDLTPSERTATDRLLVAGMHLDFPCFGHVARASSGYAFIPEVWTPTV